MSNWLDELSADKRDVLVLRLMEHRTNAEIAEILGLQPNTVAVRYRRALEELRQRLPTSLYADVWGAPQSSSDPANES